MRRGQPWKTFNRIFSHSTQPPRQLPSKLLTVSPEVAECLRNGEPVVALESTIITHGMPYPVNLEMARSVETIIRGKGATPATIALFDGRVHVGLSPEELTHLATNTTTAIKTSRRDFPFVLANKRVGGTTVSGTMVAAHAAGIPVFVTGGIGGVHRGATATMDISADLTELGRTPVMVVSAGVKSILDIGLTLEYLETQGVCVATLGSTNTFPAFYTRDSGFKSPYSVGSTLEAAQLLQSSRDMGLNSGILLGVPIPEADAGAASVLAQAIDTALAEAAQQGIAGREVTPYILGRLTELTGGESLRANLALVKHNAEVGAEVAVHLSSLASASSHPSFYSSTSASSTSASSSTQTSSSPSSSQSGPVVVGGCIFDFVVKVLEDNISMDGSTHGGRLQYSHGGVGRNVADALARLGAAPRLASAVGEDNQGSSILSGNSKLDTSLVKVEKRQSTATYTAVLDKSGECKFGVGDMEIHASIDSSYLSSVEDSLISAPLIVADGNIPEQSVGKLLELSKKNSIPFFYEPTCLRKAVKPLDSPAIDAMTYCSPNLNELASMARTLPDAASLPSVSSEAPRDSLPALATISKRLIEHYGIQVILLTMSKDGVLLVRRGEPWDPLPRKGSMVSHSNRLSAVHYPGKPATEVVSVSGAGDCLTAGFIAALLRGLPQDKAVGVGMQAAKLSCGVSAAIPESLDPHGIDWEVEVEQSIID